MVTTAATLVLHGSRLLQRVMAVGFVTSTMAFSDTCIKLSELPVVKQIGNRDETNVGIEMGVGFDRNVGA
jgi:hypothetical protein